MTYLIFSLIFALGFLLGGTAMFFQIKTYRKSLGLPGDPFKAGVEHFI